MTSRPASDRDPVTVLLGAAAIVVVAICLGLLANQRSSQGVPLFASEQTLRHPVPPGVRYMSLHEARIQFGAPDVVFLDARVPEAFAAGRVLGASNLPVDDFAKRHPPLQQRLQGARLLILYCDTIICDDAARLSALLEAAGYPRIALMFEGLEKWQEAGYPWTSDPKADR